MKFIDLFAGVGGFRRGMELAGHKCVGFCEWDKFAAASYISMHLLTDEQRTKLAAMDIKKRQKEILKEEYRNGEWYSPDVQLIKGDTIPRADCWCFGAPCQDFSVAGKRAGLDGDRSSLVREVFRILAEIPEKDRPEWLIYENVKGMLSSNRGADYAAIILEMGELGYDIEWELFNSKNLGVPQNRERVYTVGHLRIRGRKQIFPLKGADGENNVFGVKPTVIGGIGDKNFGRQYHEGNRVYDGAKIATALKASNVGSAGGATNLYSVPVKILGHREGYRRNTQVFAPDGVTEALSTCQGGGREHHVPVMFGIDYNVNGEERDIANCLKARYDAGVSNFRQDRTAVAVPLSISETPAVEQGNTSDLGDENVPTNKTFAGKYTMHTPKGICRTLIGCSQGSGSGNEPKVAIPVLTPDRAEKRQDGRRFKENGEPSFTLTSQDKHGVAIGVLRGVRSEYGKEIRKDYENGTVKVSRHEFREYEVRTDNISNTVDTVQKDNLLAVSVSAAQEVPLSIAGYNVTESDNIAHCLNATDQRKVFGANQERTVVGLKINEDTPENSEQGITVQINKTDSVYAVWYEKYQCYIAIRKLTPKECFRLQGWTDDYFEKAAFVNSDSQLYKQAGNGVTVNVVAEIGRAIANATDTPTSATTANRDSLAHDRQKRLF